MIDFQGTSYFDDRLFVLSLCRGRIQSGPEGTVETTILHESNADDLIWCLATYRNCQKFPLVSLIHFESKDDATKYATLIEPSVPLISLNGRSPNPTPSYSHYVKWKRDNGMSDFDYKKAHSPGGENPRELIIQTEEQFLQSKQKVATALASFHTSNR